MTGVVFDWSAETRFQDKNCSSASPSALYGCGKGIDGAPLSARGDFRTLAGLDLGIGYVMAPSLRLEAVMQYRPGFSFRGSSNFVQTADRQDVQRIYPPCTACLRGTGISTNSACPGSGP